MKPWSRQLRRKYSIVLLFILFIAFRLKGVPTGAAFECKVHLIDDGHDAFLLIEDGGGGNSSSLTSLNRFQPYDDCP